MLLLAVLLAQLADSPIDLTQRAAAAYAAGNYAEAASLGTRVLALLPRSVSTRVNIARALARQGKSAEAIARLREIAAFGIRFDPADPAFDAIRNSDAFRDAAARMEGATAPIVRSETAFLLEKDLIPESLVYDEKTKSFYVGSLYKRKILRVAAGGSTSDFVPPAGDGLWSVLGMKIDAAHRELWVNSCNGDDPPMQTPDPENHGKAAIFRFHLDSGKLIAKHPLPGGDAKDPRCVNDLVVTSKGVAYATGTGGVHRVSRDGGALELFEPFPNSFTNGIALSPDESALFVAALEGIVRIDLATRKRSLIELPESVVMGGIDGLYFHDRSLIAIQNGGRPMRVVRAWLDPELRRATHFAVLEQGHPLSDVPLTGAIVGRSLYYVARSQIDAFVNGTIWPDEKLKETVILKLPIDLPSMP
jgi:sugar lactone lactonase YvrE